MYDVSSLSPIVKNETTIVTTAVRLVSSSLFRKSEEGDYPSHKYECTVAFDVNKDPKLLEALQSAVSAAIEWGRKEGLWTDSLPSDFRCCLRAGTDYDEAGVSHPNGSYFLTAKSEYSPRKINEERRRITDEREFFPGCLVRVQIEIYPWRRTGEDRGGVSAALYAVQKVPSPEAVVDMDDFFIPWVEDVDQSVTTPADDMQDDGIELSR